MSGAGTTGGYRSAPPPPGLVQAVNRASKLFHVPAAVLIGIWRGESGSTYPNPAVNSSGYGGLFGTKLWNGSTQAQANYAASILHNALVSTKGNLQQALNIYQTGSPSKGSYSIQPFGVRTAGIILKGYGSKGNSSFGSVPVKTQTPSKTKISKVLNQYLSGNISKKKAEKILGGATISDNTFGSLGNLAHDLSPATWIDKLIYALAVGGGGLVTILGLLLTAADIGLSTRAGKVAAVIPAGRLVTKAARPVTSRTERRAATESRANEERRKEERHTADVKLKQAKATEVRTRQRNRRKGKKEQEAAETKAYYRGATDAVSPTMAKIRRK